MLQKHLARHDTISRKSSGPESSDPRDLSGYREDTVPFESKGARIYGSLMMPLKEELIPIIVQSIRQLTWLGNLFYKFKIRNPHHPPARERQCGYLCN